LLTIDGDPLILRQAFLAIIHNAVKYSPPQGSICARVKVADGDAIIEIRDSGKGIPLEHRKRVFERFYRIDKSRTRAEGGAGLGLSIAEWGVRAHGGRIELDCDPGPGCTFRIRLPMHPS